MAEYDSLLRETLRLPKITDVAKGAARSVHCIYMPSFDPECAVSIAQVGDRTSMAIRTVQRSIWAFCMARRGQLLADPIVDWVEPAFAVEHCDGFDGAEALWIEATRCSALAPARNELGVDGMIVQIEVSHTPAEVHRCRRRLVGSLGSDDACTRLAVELRRVAMTVATMDSSRVTLARLSRYMAA